MLFNSTQWVLAAPNEKNDSRECRSNVDIKVANEASCSERGKVSAWFEITASLPPDTSDAADVVDCDRIDDVAVLTAWWAIVATGLLSVTEPPPSSETSLDPHMTKSIGNNFGQLLTNSAVLTAFALGGGGGRSGCICKNAVDTRREGACWLASGALSGGQYDEGKPLLPGAGEGGLCRMSWLDGDRLRLFTPEVVAAGVVGMSLAASLGSIEGSNFRGMSEAPSRTTK